MLITPCPLSAVPIGLTPRPLEIASLVLVFQPNVDALRPKVGSLKRERGANRKARGRSSGRWNLVGIDHAVDLIAGPNDIAQVEEVVTDEDPQPLGDLISEIDGRLRSDDKHFAAEATAIARQCQKAAREGGGTKPRI